MSIQNATPEFLQVLKSHDQWAAVFGVCQTLQKNGFDALLAGGCVRDGFLGVPPKDFDVATNAKPEEVEALFSRTIAVGRQFGVMVVIPEGAEQVEVATFRADGLYVDGRRPESVTFSNPREDAARRDFTINALFFDPVAGVIHDYVDGIRDLRAKLIRAVGDPTRRFQEDHLRILRAVRFCSQLGFVIEPATRSAIAPMAMQISTVSRERIRDEIDKTLIGRDVLAGLNELVNLQLAKPVFQDWSSVLFPAPAALACVANVDVKRLIFYSAGIRQARRESLQSRLHDWKYGRAFIEKALWMLSHQEELRLEEEDPVKSLQERQKRVAAFQIKAGDRYSPVELAWMKSLEVWLDEKSVDVCGALDALLGLDSRREQALARRNLKLGGAKYWKSQPKSAEVQSLAKAQSVVLEGADLGRQIKRLTLDLLLFTRGLE